MKMMERKYNGGTASKLAPDMCTFVLLCSIDLTSMFSKCSAFMFCLAPAYTGPAAPRSGDKVLKIMEKLGDVMTCNLLPSSASLSVGFVQGGT